MYVCRNIWWCATYLPHKSWHRSHPLNFMWKWLMGTWHTDHLLHHIACWNQFSLDMPNFTLSHFHGSALNIFSGCKSPREITLSHNRQNNYCIITHKYCFNRIDSLSCTLSPLYIFISVTVELSLYSWIAGLDDDIHWSELFLLRVCNQVTIPIKLHIS